MVEFFKKRFGYGLAGLLVGLFIVAAYAFFSKTDNIPGWLILVIMLVPDATFNTILLLE